MASSISNFYRLTTATSVANSGYGSNALSKPAGSEVASIVPGKKYSVYIPTAATFSTNFGADEPNFHVLFYAKPNPGVVADVAGVQLVFDGNTYSVTNSVGDSVSFPQVTHSAHLFMLAFSDGILSVTIDGHTDNIDAEILSGVTPHTVSLLQSGGILDHVQASPNLLSSSDSANLFADYLTPRAVAPETIMMFDENRDFVTKRTVASVLHIAPGEVKTIKLDASDCIAFKVEYTASAGVSVSINGTPGYSGFWSTDPPGDIVFVSVDGGTVTDLTVTEYNSNDVSGVSVALITTDAASGTPAPTHMHSDSAAAYGDTAIVLTETASSISGWFYATDGAVLPGVTMSGGVLSGSGLYVNGKAYSGAVLRDWYFLTKNSNTSGSFTIEVPVHSLTVATATMTADGIDDLYESFFGNPTFTANAVTLGIASQPAFIVSTEWSIVGSG